MKKVDYNEIVENLKYATLTCEQIAQITGHSLYAAKRMRLLIIEKFNDKFPYSTSAHVRTDHFVSWYDNPVINKAYATLYDLNSTSEGVANTHPFVFYNQQCYS